MSNQIYPTKTLAADGTVTYLVPGGEYAVTVAGTWGSGTATVKWHDGTQAVAYPNAALTADGGIVVAAGTGRIDIVLAGSTNPALTITLNKVS